MFLVLLWVLFPVGHALQREDLTTSTGSFCRRSGSTPEILSDFCVPCLIFKAWFRLLWEIYIVTYDVTENPY